jgi:DNA mismatch repair protein MutL
LFSLHTKGFRGEALASIADCACGDEDQARPRRIRNANYCCSKFVSQDMAVLPKGTSFAVNLFSIFQHVVIFKVGYGEYRHIDEFQRRFSAPKYLFHFFHNGSEMFNLLQA